MSSCHIIPHNLLSDEHVWAHPCCLTPPQEKKRWFKRSHTTRSSTWSRWRRPVDFMVPRMDLSSIYIDFVRLPLCNKYSDYIVTFISIHSVIICVVFFGAYMRCTRLCPLNPGVTTGYFLFFVFVHVLLLFTAYASSYTHMHIHVITYIALIFWIKLKLKMPNFLTYTNQQ